MRHVDLILLHPPITYRFRELPMLHGPSNVAVPSSSIFENYPIGFLTMSDHLTRQGMSVRIVNLAMKMLLDDGFDPEQFIAGLAPVAFGIDLQSMETGSLRRPSKHSWRAVAEGSTCFSWWDSPSRITPRSWLRRSIAATCWGGMARRSGSCRSSCHWLPLSTPAAGCSRSRNGSYRLFYRTLAEHRRAMLMPTWKGRLNYETRWMTRDDMVRSYDATVRLAELKAAHGLTPLFPQEVQGLERLRQVAALLGP